MKTKLDRHYKTGQLKIMLVDDDPEIREMLSDFFLQNGFQVTTAGSGSEALKQFDRQRFPLVITDLKMPSMDGMELLAEIKRRDERTMVVMITAHGSIETAVEAVKKGAYDFITKPVRLAALDMVVRHALERHFLTGRLQTLHAAILALLVSIPVALVLGMALARAIQ